MACHQELVRQMGRMVADRATIHIEELLFRYRCMLSAALAQGPRYTNNINVLLHIVGYFHNRVTSEERAYCMRLIDRYRNGHATLSEPRDLLRSWVIRFQEPSLMNQTFFAPYPVELTGLPEEITGRGRDIWKSRKPVTQLEEHDLNNSH